MPKTKRRGKGNRTEKEKPLLTVQGVLRLEKSFVTAQHEDAPTMTIQRSKEAGTEMVKLVPGQSEHDLVEYKAGYDVGPSNPYPQNEVESKIFEEHKKVEKRQEDFEEMKRRSEQERAEREERFRQQEEEKKKRRLGLMPDLPPGTEDEQKEDSGGGEEGAVVDSATQPQKEPFNPDDPNNYVLPEHLRKDPAFHNDTPLEFGVKKQVQPSQPSEKASPGAATSPLAEEKPSSSLEVAEEPGDLEGGETQELPDKMLPQMKPLPEKEASPVPSSHVLPPPMEKDMASMALDVAKEMEEKRRREARERLLAGRSGEAEEEDYYEMIYSLDEITHMNEMGTGSSRSASAAPVQGPELSQQNIKEVVRQQKAKDAKNFLDGYWQFVRENPQDFNGWCYLIEHVENMDDLLEVRDVYNAFLPLFPYCYAYWQRYSEMEKKHGNWEQALKILHRGLVAIPLSVDLWMTYLELFYKLRHGHENFTRLLRDECERAVSDVGLEFWSNPLWERYIEWEMEQKNLVWVTGIFKRLVQIPTSLYNKHWDNFIAHIRDHHPRDILDYEEYEELRKVTCKELGLTYRPDPVVQPSQPREVVMPEDKLKAGMKERIVMSIVDNHEQCEKDVKSRWDFEGKIDRNYFHVKPLKLKQLRNWEAYLDFEIGSGNHERTVVLFERCLVPAAHYEQFWAKYARYLEDYFKRETQINKGSQVDKAFKDSPLKRARFAFSTGLTKVDEIREKRCTWTLRGWKGKDKEGNEILMAEEIPKQKERSSEQPPKEKQEKPTSPPIVDQAEDSRTSPEAAADEQIDEEKTAEEEEENKLNSKGEGDKSDPKEEEEKEDVIGPVAEVHPDNSADEPVQDLRQKVDDKEESKLAYEIVRDVYKRACIVHCPKKAMIKLKWAAFEEECGEKQKAKEILTELNKQFPLLLECCIQLIDLERRMGNLERADDMYRALIKKIPQNRKSIKTWLALKYARFQFKVRMLPDKALATLRSALKRERGDPRIYTQIIDICYQRQPMDVAGVTAAIELALKSPSLANMHKFEFVKRKLEFMQDFGDEVHWRDAKEQMKSFRHLCTADLRAEARRKKELEREEQKLKEVESLKALVRADANMKAKLAEQEGRLMCTNCQTAMFPDAEGVYEFERSYSGRATAGSRLGAATATSVPEVDEDGVVDLMEWAIPEDQEEEIKKKLEEKTRYKEVAPTWELNMETYGYGKRRKVYDPDYEHVESAKFKEYERLESKGYDDNLKDLDHDKLKNINAPGLGSSKELRSRPDEQKNKYTESDYVIPPKVPQLQIGPGIGPARPRDDEAPGSEHHMTVFELPPEIANPQTSPCINVPEWFVKEGGELCLSDTANGMSILRYWPKFLSEKGNRLMFNKLRSYCKWHQKQVKIGGEWKYETRLVAWYGPCDYVYSGLHLEKNQHWAPELLDLLHRLIAMTRHEFNCCFLNLYRHGHDMCGWHADVHPQLGRNPPIASVSLGAIRVFELRKKRGAPNFIRFPLFPGSLLVMEGATQEDWLHCLPRDPNCKEERINLTFRFMYSMR